MRKIYKYILCACLTAGFMVLGEGVMMASYTFYARVTTSVTPTGSGTAYVCAGDDVSKIGTKTSDDNSADSNDEEGQEVYFSIKATANPGYHFNSWSCKFSGDYNIDSPSESVTTMWVYSTSDSKSKPTSATATATFAENFYTQVTTSVSPSGGGTAYVIYGTTFSGTATYADDGYGQASAGVTDTYSILATPATGYVFDHWEVSNGTLTDATSASTTVTVTTNSSYQGSGNKYPCTVKAVFLGQYKAKLNTAVSSALEGSSAGTATVQADDSSWGSSATKISASASTTVPFNVKATANKGYQFKGWSASDGSTSYISGLEATGTYEVSSASTEGGTNEKSIYAVFDKGTYYIHFDKNAPSGYTVEGEQMADQEITSGVATALSARAYKCYFVLSYDTKGGNALAEDKIDRFSKWNLAGTSTNYEDKEVITRTETHGSTLTLNAVWASSATFTLKTPTKVKDGVPMIFLGWYDAATGGTKIGDAGQSVTLTSSQTVYAHWKENNITVSASGTGGTSGGRIVFNVRRTGTPAIQYRISVPIGGSKTIKDLPVGEYTVTPETDWSWDCNINPTEQTQTFSGSATEESETLSFDFNVTAKADTKKHAEASNTVTSF